MYIAIMNEPSLVVPFVMYCRAEILYEGRASSTLETGNYLIILKSDRSLSVHGGDKVIPKNYLSGGSKLTYQANPCAIVASRRGEVVKILIESIYWYHNIEDWSTNDIVISKTEKELVDKLVSNLGQYFGVQPGDAVVVVTEYPTDVGPVDIIIQYADEFWVVEVKRAKINLNNCLQLKKYVDHLRAIGRKVRPFIAGPAIADKAKYWCDENAYDWVKVDFDDS